MREQNIEPEPAQDKNPPKQGSYSLIGIASLISAVSVFIFTWLVQKTLPAQETNVFLVYWSFGSLIFASIVGIQHETARAVGFTLARSEQPTSLTRRAHPLKMGSIIGGLVALGLVATSPLWGRAVFGEQYFLNVLSIAVATALYAAHVSVVGIFAGYKHWDVFSFLITAEGLIRLGISLTVAFLFLSITGYKFAFIAPVILWLILIGLSPKNRAMVTQACVVESPKVLAQQMTWSIFSTVAFAIMSTGFPVLLQISYGHKGSVEQQALMAAVILGINITRAPVMIPLQAFQGVAISAFLEQRHRPVSALAKPVGIILGVGFGGGVLAYLIGPFLFDLIYKNLQGILSAPVLALMTVDSALMALVVLSGTATLAMNLHRLYLSGWIVTVAVAVALLYLLPFSVDWGASTALFIAPLLGFFTHLAGLVYSGRKE